MSSSAGLRIVIAIAAVVVGAGGLSLFRPGYTPDEEFTIFAVRGIETHGLPLLPSGLLYDRGLLYSYVCWVAFALTGVELPAFRAVSLLVSAGTLVLGYALLRKVASPAAGVVAALLVATSVPFWAAATTGRFYALFIFTSVAVLAAFARLAPERDTPPGPGTRLALFALTFLSRLTHELAFTLMAIPAAALAVHLGHLRLSAVYLREAAPYLRASAAHLRASAAYLRPFAAVAAGLLAAQALLMGLHFLMPPDGSGGGTMIERFFLWQVLNLFERPVGGPLGVVLAALVLSWLIVPALAIRSLIVGLGTAAVVVAAGLAYAASAAPLSVPVAQGVISRGLAYPLDMFWHLAGDHPVMLGVAMVLLLARLCGAGGEWPAGERAAHLGWLGWVLWFGVIESGITINYILLPTVCLLAAIGVDLVAIGQHVAAVWPGRRGQLMRAALTGVALLVVADQWSGTGTVLERLAVARPTIDVEGLETVRTSLQPTDRVACTDELACVLLVGRVDAWLALDDYVRERFVVMRGANRVGVYAGAPAVFGLAGLFAADPDGAAPARVILVDVFKPYPVGNSITWLPRALEAEGLEARALLATPHARVLELGGRR